MRMTMFIWEYWNNSIQGVHECWALQQWGKRGSHCRFYGRTCWTELHWVTVIINVIMNVIMIVVINVIIDQDKTTVLPRHLRLPLGLWWAQHLALCLISTRKKKLIFLFKWNCTYLEKIMINLQLGLEFLISKPNLALRIRIGWYEWLAKKAESITNWVDHGASVICYKHSN